MQRRKDDNAPTSSRRVGSSNRIREDGGGRGVKVGVPVGAIQHALGYPPSGGVEARPLEEGETTGASTRPFIEVEVETTQGYVYAGKLVEIDAHYNITLREAMVRRERACDVQRALRREHWRQQQKLMFGMMNHDVPLSVLGVEVGEERADSATRPRYVGTTLIRSSSLFMIRFIGDGAIAAIRDKSAECHGEGGPSRKKARSESSPQSALRRAFVEAATAAKKAIEQERRKNRLERQKRKTAAKTETAIKK
ncbi:unnamed protein product [Phytomonas sp. EM1]|nr:unnamed protein product [Phytomonas sp. EM1]|eukprot:CCW63969.1 unnamed protein product [Phytomonas sp. isolate EM1]